mmetsp:Transcript_42260/g.107425  ORF Transcript_42260/g.107425 Transcript_42260/m.107425 type:complete len:297 (+) Transcript_42260:622-1512(+)
MAAVLVAFSVLRSSVASACSFLSSPSASLSSASCCVSCALSASCLSTPAEISSTSDCLLSRVCLFVASSVSQYAFWSPSPLASSMSLTIKSLTIVLIFPKGSACAWVASKERYRLPILDARPFRKAMRCSRFCASCGLSVPRSCTRAVPRLLPSWSKAGRCSSAAPETSSLPKISMACSMALISSARRTWFFSNSWDLDWHEVKVSASFFSSSALPACVVLRSPLATAASSSFCAFVAVFSLVLLLLSLMLSESFCASISKLALPFISSFSKVSFWSWNLMSKFWSMPTMLPDCDS